MTSVMKDSSSRAAGLLTVQLGVELKARWTKRCVQRGVVPGKALREMVEGAVSDAAEAHAAKTRAPALKVRLGSRPDSDPKIGREVQFTGSENAAIEAAAAAEGFAFQEWIVAAARAALVQVPSYGQSELEALTQSNARMAAIAVDLAAVRRQVGEGSGALVDPLAALEAEIRQHVEKVSAVMAQGVQRWQLGI